MTRREVSVTPTRALSVKRFLLPAINDICQHSLPIAFANYLEKHAAAVATQIFAIQLHENIFVGGQFAVWLSVGSSKSEVQTPHLALGQFGKKRMKRCHANK